MIDGTQVRLLAVLSATTFFLSACSDSTQNATGTSDAGLDASTDAMGTIDGGVEGGADAFQIAPPAMLQSGVAGKACTMASDCPTGGMCAMQLQLGGPLAMFTGGGMMVTTPGGYCTATCMDDSSCGMGGVCNGAFSAMGMSVAGTCEKSCSQDSDCRSGYRCAGLPTAGVDASSAASTSPVMLPPTPPGCAPIPMTAMLAPGAAGMPCSMDSDCGGTGGSCLTATTSPLGPGASYPGGYCTGNCLKDSDCGTGGRCVPPTLSQGAGSCNQGCTADSDCRSGYRCRDQGVGFSACEPGDPKVPNGQVGQACTVSDGGTSPVSGTSADAGASPDSGTSSDSGANPDSGPSPGCGSNCMSSLGGALAMFGGGGMMAPDGYCSANCVDDSDCGGGVCLGAISFPGISGTGICFKTCSADTDCRTGYSCTAYSNPLAALTGGAAPTTGGDGGAAPNVCQPAMSADQ